ncbi:dihydrofolate reductase family protein [Paenibacillus glacialis]|uniref:Pyrimidine reductase n=1 Tax=Paenibacillus glacialis TaxID=494026 RepID=A0A168N0X4_9BACL|nr:dihydrofolate reductase family protein [Paenibacillus glacialis]OAB45266.1 pyrimidine reductase [Paenibacillus glacialis]
MRKLCVSEFVTLDGVMENPQWTFKFLSDEQDKYKFDEMKASDALLLGRVTYDGFAQAWPNMIEETGEYGEMMNGYAKHVVSTTLDEVKWNNSTLIKDNIVEEISKLKQQPGKDILVFGSCDLVQTLIANDLIDEYRLMVFPIVIGNGKRLFADKIDEKVFKLVDTKTFSSGVVVLTYQSKESE